MDSGLHFAQPRIVTARGRVVDQAASGDATEASTRARFGWS